MLFGRRRFDRPADRAGGGAARDGRRAVQQGGHPPRAELAGGEPVAVLSILKVYGSSFGLPNPGLLPTRQERERAVRDRAAGDHRTGAARLHGDGQIAATRSAGRTIAKVARRRQVRYVVMDDSDPGGMRRVTEGWIPPSSAAGSATGPNSSWSPGPRPRPPLDEIQARS